MERKIVLAEKAPVRQMIEIDSDIHREIAFLSEDTGITMRDIVSTLLRDALKYVVVEEYKNTGLKQKRRDRDITAKNKKDYQHNYYLTVTKPKRAAKRKGK